MSLNSLGSIPTLLDVNIAAGAAIGFLNPLAAQLDLMLFGSFGLGALQADLSAQFNAAISAQAHLSIQVSNPLAAIQQLISAVAQLQASLNLALSLGIPTVSVELSAQLSAAAALSASLAVKLGGISALLAAAINLQIPLASFIANLVASLSLGPITLYSFDPDPPTPNLAAVGSAINAEFSGSIPGGIQSTDPVYGLLMVVDSPSVYAGISAILKTS